MTKCYKCHRKATYFCVVKDKDGKAQVVETCGLHQKLTIEEINLVQRAQGQ